MRTVTEILADFRPSSVTDQIAEAHDRRVTELLRVTEREVNRRRQAESKLRTITGTPSARTACDPHQENAVPDQTVICPGCSTPNRHGAGPGATCGICGTLLVPDRGEPGYWPIGHVRLLVEVCHEQGLTVEQAVARLRNPLMIVDQGTERIGAVVTGTFDDYFAAGKITPPPALAAED